MRTTVEITFAQYVKMRQKGWKFREAYLYELTNPEAEIFFVTDHPLGIKRPIRVMKRGKEGE